MQVYGIQKSTLESCHKSEVVLAGKFRPNGSSNPTIWYGNWIDTIVHNSTGYWTLTVKRNYRNMVGEHCGITTLQYAYTNFYMPYLGAIDWSAGTVDIYNVNANTGVLSDLSSNPNIWINLCFVMKHMKIPDGDLLVSL